MLVAFVVLLSLGAVARTTEFMAVLPLDVRQAELPRAACTGLEEALRAAAADLLAAQGVGVLTADNTVRVLRDNGVEPERLCEASCAVDLGRELKARWIVAGSVVTAEGAHTAFVRLYDVPSGNLLASVKVKGASVRALEDEADRLAPTLFTKAGLARRTVSPTVTMEPTAELTIDAEPRGKTRLELVAPDGRALGGPAPFHVPAARAGHWSVRALAPGFLPEALEFELATGESRLVALELKRPATGLAAGLSERTPDSLPAALGGTWKVIDAVAPPPAPATHAPPPRAARIAGLEAFPLALVAVLGAEVRAHDVDGKARAAIELSLASSLARGLERHRILVLNPDESRASLQRISQGTIDLESSAPATVGETLGARVVVSASLHPSDVGYLLDVEAFDVEAQAPICAVLLRGDTVNDLRRGFDERSRAFARHVIEAIGERRGDSPGGD